MQKVDVLQLLKTVNLDLKPSSTKNQSGSNFGDIFSSISKPKNDDITLQRKDNDNNIKNNHNVESRDDVNGSYDKKNSSGISKDENCRKESRNNKIDDKKDAKGDKDISHKEKTKVKENEKDKRSKNIKDEDKGQLNSNIEASIKSELQAIVDKLEKDGVKLDDLNGDELKKVVSKIEEKLNKKLGDKLNIKITVDKNFKVEVEPKSVDSNKLKNSKFDNKNGSSEKIAQIEKVIQSVVDEIAGSNHKKKSVRKISKMHLVKLQVKNEVETRKSNGEIKVSDKDSIKKIQNSDVDKLVLSSNHKKNVKKNVKKNHQNNKMVTGNKIDLNALKFREISSKNIKINKITQNVEQNSRKVIVNSKIKATDKVSKGKNIIFSMVKEGNMQGITTNKAKHSQKMTPVSQIAYGIKQSKKTTKLTVNLYPEKLGKVTLDLSVKGNNLVAKFKTDSVHTKDNLQMNVHILRDALAEKGFDVKNMDFKFDTYDENHQGNSGGNQNNQEQEKEQNREENRFSMFEEEEENNSSFFSGSGKIGSFMRSINSMKFDNINMRI